MDDSDFIFIEEGDSLPDYYEYTYPEFPDEVIDSGYKGLTYTFNGARVYDTIYDSDISPDDCIYVGNENESEEEDFYKNNAFILVDMTATYENESGDAEKDMISPAAEFEGSYLVGDNYKAYSDEELDFPYSDPMFVYFSEAPEDGDKTADGSKLDFAHNANVFGKPLKSGDTVDFQIGLVAKKDFIDDNNLFMCLRHREPPVEGCKIYYIDLLGRFKNE